MHNVYLFQPQYAVEFRKETTYWIPYSVGCLWSYVLQFTDIVDNFQLKEFIFRREPPEQVLSRLDNPAVCGFSCYVWNEKYCLSLAKLIKDRWPNCIIQFGGSQSSGKLLKYDFIDTIFSSEGEENFLQSLRDIVAGRLPEKFYQKRRLENLDIPSPYALGLFDSLIEQNPGAVWSMTFETNRGCPYSCTFCDWGGITYSKIKKFNLDRVREDLEWSIGKPISYVYCADANFGIFKDRDLEIAHMIKDIAQKGGTIDSVNLQYAKNSTDVVFEIAKTIGNLSRGVTVSVQSMNNNTLDAVERKNLNINNIAHLMDLSERYGVSTYTEVILGLPLETLETWKQGFSEILEMGQHQSIDMWLAQLLENSELNQDKSRQQYGIKSVIAKDYMTLYNVNDWRDIDEEIELINQTSTMSTRDLVEGYMYGWMIIHFHINGYSQHFAKYCRYILNISYRQFYDQLFAYLQHKNTVFQEHFQKLYSVVDHYLQTGEMIKFDDYKASGHGIHALSYEFVYNNRNQAYALSQAVAELFGYVPDSVISVQKNFVYDPNQSYPIVIDTEYDLTNWESAPSQYVIDAKFPIGQEFDFYALRRQGLVKNKFVKSG
jgi:putative methyltransferase